MFAFLKYFVFLTFVIEEFYFNISFPQRYQWELGEWKWWPPFHESKLSDNTQFLLILRTMLSLAMCILRPIKI